MDWLLFIVLSTLFLFTPYHRGLYFENETFVVIGILLACFIAAGLMPVFKRKSLGKVPALYYAVFLIPLSYIPAFLTAESPLDNFMFLFRWLAFSGFFILLLWLRRSAVPAGLFPFFFQLCGIGMGVVSVLGYTGLLYYTGMVSEDARLTGPVQYPNTFGALMGAYCLYSLVVLSDKRGSRIGRLLYSVPLMMYGTVLLLTYSRGALLFLAAIWAVVLIILDIRHQVMAVFYTGVFGVGSLVLFRIAEHGFEGNPVPLLAALTLAGMLMALLDQVYARGGWDRLLDRLGTAAYTRRLGRWALLAPVGGAGLLAAADIRLHGLLYGILPVSLQEKLTDIGTGAKSVLGRMEMYRDAMRIFRGNPITGTGGDGWEYMFSYYQTVPYYTREVHSGYLEVLVNTGIVGGILFTAAAVVLIAGLVRGYRESKDREKTAAAAGIGAVLMLAAHAMVDFDYSFGTVWLIVLWLIAMVVPVDRSPIRLSKALKRRLAKPAWRRAGLAAVVGTASVCFAGYSWIYVNDRRVGNMERANMLRGIGLEEGLQLYETAFRRNPFSTDLANKALLAYTQKYMVTKDKADLSKMEELAARAEGLEPHNSRLLSYIGQAFYQAGEYDRAFDYLDRAIQVEPFDVSIPDVSIPLKLEAALAVSAEREAAQKERYLRMAAGDMERYNRRVGPYKDRLIPDARRLELKPDTYISAARAYLEMGQAEPAYRSLQSLKLAEDDGIYDKERDRVMVDRFVIQPLVEVLDKHKDDIVLLSVKDEAANRLSPVFVKQMQERGGKDIGGLSFWGSYAAVIVKGQVIAEAVNGEGPAELKPENAPEVSQALGEKPFRIYSAGNPYGNRSSIMVNGKEYSPGKKGLNIAVLDRNGQFIRSYSYDTHLSNLTLARLDGGAGNTTEAVAAGNR